MKAREKKKIQGPEESVNIIINLIFIHIHYFLILHDSQGAILCFQANIIFITKRAPLFGFVLLFN